MKILVTGAKGFLGRFLVQHLRDKRLEVVETDILDSVLTDYWQTHELVREAKPDVSMNLAALAGASGTGGAPESKKSPHKFFQTNVSISLNVFEAARQLDVGSVLQMSSFSPYGRTDPGVAIDEDTPLRPNNPYGGSKACVETIAKVYSECYGIRCVLFRAPLLAGEGQKEQNAVQEFIRLAIEGKDIRIFGDGKHRREWLHPLDISQAYEKAIGYVERVKGLDTIVLGSEMNRISMVELAGMIIRKVGRGRLEFSPTSSLAFDQITKASKARDLLGWTAQISLNQIIDRILVHDYKVEPRSNESRAVASAKS